MNTDESTDSATVEQLKLDVARDSERTPIRIAKPSSAVNSMLINS